MSLSRTEITNLGLRELTALRVDDWQEDSPQADIARDVWNQARKKTLVRTDWSFARRTRKLGRNDAGSDYGEDHYYEQPGDYIRFIAASDNADFEPPLYDNDFRHEEGRFYTDVDDFYLKYVFDQTNTGVWSPLFVDVFVADLASVMASPLKSTTAREGLEELARSRLRDGRSGEASQKPTRYLPPSNWVRAQKGGRARSPAAKWNW